MLASGLTVATALDFPWVNLVWVLVGIVILLFTVAGVGRLLAATHPEAPARPAAPETAPAATEAASGPGEVAAAIASAVYVTMGASAKVTSVTPAPTHPVSVENLMLTWSLEGRRQIYTSHKVR